MLGGESPGPQNGSVRRTHCGGGTTHSQLPELPSMHVWPGGQGAVPHAPENEPIQVNGAVVVGQEVVVVVVFVGGHDPQSAGHVLSLPAALPISTSGSFYRHSQAVEHAGGS